MLAGVGVSWVSRLEQGRVTTTAPEVLDALARALRLRPDERAHLFVLAEMADPAPPPARPRPPDGAVALLDALEPNPAYVLDHRWTMVAWNRAEARLFPPLADAVPGTVNLLELVVADPRLRELMADWPAETARLVGQFRAHAGRRRDPAVDDLVERLSAHSVEFARLWASRDVAGFTSTQRHFAHPVVGDLRLVHHRLALADAPEFELVAYTPATDDDRRALARLAEG